MRRRKDRSQVDIASRRTSKNRELSGEFLDGTESSVIEIGPTAGKGFEEAWALSADENSDHSLDSAISVGQDDSKERSLDGSRSATYLGAAAFLIGIGVIAFFATRAATAPDPNLGARASEDTERNVLSSPLAEREYADLVSPLAIEVVESLDESFVEADGSLLPDPGRVNNSQILVGPVFWAGRTHIAVAGDQALLAENECLVSSLVTADLQAVDVASAGDCDESFAATGDRVACQGENVLLLEVWPFNPDSVTEPRDVLAIRTRIERSVDDEVLSVRGSLEIAEGSTSPLVAASTTLEGRPGDAITMQLGELSGDCTLVDRSTADVRLLPG